MARFLKKPTKEMGLPPGSLVFVGEQKMENPSLRLIDFSAEDCLERQVETVGEFIESRNSKGIAWVNVDGVHDAKVIDEIGSVFDLSPLLLEDIMHTGHRPKIIEYEKCMFVVLKMLRFEEKSEKILSEQLSIVVANNFLITFQEQRGDIFEPVRERIRNGRKRIRSSKPDFLAYSLLDVVCEKYILIIEILGEKIDVLEAELLDHPKKEILLQINRYKQEINYLRKCIRPVREILLQITKSENSVINGESMEYWRDLQILVIQANESIDSYRDVLNDQLSLYHSTVSTKMNDIMKVLTIFSTIFIPLTFIAGIYGTNFDVLPELHYENSYFYMLIVMAVIALIMLIIFKRQKWF